MRHFIEKHAEAAKAARPLKNAGFIIENVSRRSILGGILTSTGLVLSLKVLTPAKRRPSRSMRTAVSACRTASSWTPRSSSRSTRTAP